MTTKKITLELTDDISVLKNAPDSQGLILVSKSDGKIYDNCISIEDGQITDDGTLEEFDGLTFEDCCANYFFMLKI